MLSRGVVISSCASKILSYHILLLLAHISPEMICASFFFISLPRRTINEMNVGRPKREREREKNSTRPPPTHPLFWDDGKEGRSGTETISVSTNILDGRPMQ